MAWPLAAGAAIAAGASLLGGFLSNRENTRLYRENRDWSQWMSGSAHQREVNDLRKAGLNPILSAGGSGASTPSANPNQMENIIGPSVESAVAALNLDREIRSTESQIALNQAQGEAQRASAQASAATAKQANTQTLALEKQMPAIDAESRYNAKQAKWNEKAINFDNISNRVNSTLKSVNSAKDLFVPKVKIETGKKPQGPDGLINLP